METPYRNLSLFELIIKTCSPNLFLGLAANIGGNPSIIQTKRISDWKTAPIPKLHKLPTIFSLGN
jgi:16S rRNA (cytidine1402-2'-O)-methyltransferase